MDVNRPIYSASPTREDTEEKIQRSKKMLKQMILIATLAFFAAQANVVERQKRAELDDQCVGDDGPVSGDPFPNPADCNTYLQCSNGYLYTMACPDGLVFNPDTTQCDYLDNVPRCQPTEPPTSNEMSSVICEHDTGKISCDRFHTLVITSAFYGRDEPDTCGGPVKTTDCKAVGSTTKIMDECNSENECSLFADNKVFGDPCYGTFKYIRVSYKCRRNIDIID